MQTQLLIVNSDGIAATYEEVRAGKLGFIEAGALVASPTGAEVQITLGDETLSPFSAGELLDGVKVTPDVGTAQEATVDLTGADGTLYVKLINTTIGTMDVAMKSFEAADAAKIAALIVKEGAKPESPFAGFSAAEAAGVITVTAPVNSTFRLAATDGAVITYTVTPEPSRGQASDMTKLEENTLYSKGVTNKVGFPVVKPASSVVAGAQYVQYIYDVAKSVPNKAGTGTAAQERYKVIVAVNTAATNTLLALDGDAITEEA